MNLKNIGCFTGDEHSMRLAALSSVLGQEDPYLTPDDFTSIDTFIGGSGGGPHHLAIRKLYEFPCVVNFGGNLTLNALRPFTWLLPGSIGSVARLLAHHLL